MAEISGTSWSGLALNFLLNFLRLQIRAAILAEGRTLPIRIANMLREMHHAQRVRAMLEPQRMPNFMDRFLKHSVPKQALVLGSGFQASCGNDRHVAWASGLAEYEVHARDIEVKGCDT